MSDTLSILRAARARIADPARWCVGCLACTGEPPKKQYSFLDQGLVCVASPLARQWDMFGALFKEMPDGVNVYHHEAYYTLRAAAERLHGKDWWRVNDYMGHAAVLEVYDAAIAAAERNPARGEL